MFQIQIICKFSNERMCKCNKDVERLSCGFEDLYLFDENIFICRQRYITLRKNMFLKYINQGNRIKMSIT